MMGFDANIYLYVILSHVAATPVLAEGARENLALC
jgi:hypothetical protein